MKKQISLIGCFASVACCAVMAAVGTVPSTAFAEATFTNDAKDATNPATLKELLLEAGHVITVEVGGVISIGISADTPNGDGIFQNAAYAKTYQHETAAATFKKAGNTATLGTAIATATAKAKTLFDIDDGIARVAEKAAYYFAKTGANGHFTAAGAAAIGA